MKNILITGGTGFIANSILSIFKLDDSYNIYLVVRNKKKIDKSSFNKFKIIYCDDFFNQKISWYKSLLKNIDIVIHNAWYTKHSDYLESNINLECLKGSKIFYDAILSSNVKKLLTLGTCFEYQFTSKNLSSRSKLEPTNLYSLSKKFLYDYGKITFSGSSVKFYWCRLFFVYGSGEPKTKLYSSIILHLTRNKKILLSNGYQIRDFIHVDDVAKKIYKIVNNNTIYPSSINICSGVGVSVRQFAINIAKKMGKEHLLQFGKKKLNSTDPLRVVGIDNVR